MSVASRTLLTVAAATCLGSLALAGCSLDKPDDAKGIVDDSLPPTRPTADDGKADAGSRIVPISVESPHPYTNNLDRVWRVDLSTLPSCTQRVRLHFSVLRTEARYDFVTVEPTSGVIQSFDGTHDDTWTEWIDTRERFVNVRLDTDGSITRHGFAIDRVEWDGVPDRCPLYPIQPCPESAISLRAPVAACECPPAPSCAGLATVEIRHATSRGRLFGGKHVVGLDAFTLGLGPTDRIQETAVGTVAADRLVGLVHLAQTTGVLFDAGYETTVEPGVVRDELYIKAGNFEAVFVAPQGQHEAEVQSVITAFEALFSCAAADAAITCAAGRTCQDDTCQPESSCVCAEIYQPVCGIDGRTYGNACSAGCAGADIAHDGACGLVGDMCGGPLGRPCLDDNKCRYDVSTFAAPVPNAAGACVARTYCDAPADCNGLPAPAVLGAWACEANTCAFRAGPQWRDLGGGSFETAHPYGNSTSVWKQLTLPVDAQALRLRTSGSFALERNYDFLEVWTWSGTSWRQVRRYTGAVAPALTDEFAGRYHYLRFVSDGSVTAHGFAVVAQWR